MSFYDQAEVHRLLVGDEVRTQAFRDAVFAAVEPGAVVLDVGSGSGILSLFAAQAGASRVYAIERAPGAAALARRLIAANGLASVVHVIVQDLEWVRLPEQVDVIVSEWLGAYGVDENMLSSVLLARDRWLKRGGTMVPNAVTGWIAPVCHEAGREALLFRTRRYGLDLSALAPHPLDQAVWLPSGVTPEQLRSEPQKLWDTDCTSMSVADARAPIAARLRIRLSSGGVNGLATWFSAEMASGRTLSNGPGCPRTHWGQLLFPVANANDLGAGDELHVEFHNVPWGPYGSHHIWATRAAGVLEVHDTRRSWASARGPAWRIYQARNGEPGRLT